MQLSDFGHAHMHNTEHACLAFPRLPLSFHWCVILHYSSRGLCIKRELGNGKTGRNPELRGAKYRASPPFSLSRKGTFTNLPNYSSTTQDWLCLFLNFFVINGARSLLINWKTFNFGHAMLKTWSCVTKNLLSNRPRKFTQHHVVPGPPPIFLPFSSHLLYGR